MLQNTEIGLGLYSDRAYNIMRALIDNLGGGKLQYKMYVTLDCMRLEQRPNNEAVLVLRSTPSMHNSRWRNADTPQQAKRELASLLKYSAAYKSGGGDGYTKAASRTRYNFTFGFVTAVEVKTVTDLLSGRRPRNPEYVDALVGVPRDEVEAGLEAARRAEIAKAKEDSASLVSQIKADAQKEYDVITQEFNEKYNEILSLKRTKREVVHNRCEAGIKAANEALSAELAKINKKYR